MHLKQKTINPQVKVRLIIQALSNLQGLLQWRLINVSTLIHIRNKITFSLIHEMYMRTF